MTPIKEASRNLQFNERLQNVTKLDHKQKSIDANVIDM